MSPDDPDLYVGGRDPSRTVGPMTAAPRTLTADEAIAELGEDAVATAMRHALWRRGDLRYLLHPGQVEALSLIDDAWRSGTVRFVVNVGRRWGKSWLMAVICAIVLTCRALWRAGEVTEDDLAEMYDPWLVHAITRSRAKARVLYAAPTADMIAEFIAPHFDMLEAHAPPELRITTHKGDYVGPSGDRVVMKGCEDRAKANRLRGPEADLAIADEGGFVPILGYVVRSAIGFQLAETEGMCLMPSTPPESPDHPYVGFAVEAMERGAYYHATSHEAPHLTARMLGRMIENAGGEDSADWQREGLAEFVRDPQIVVLPEFDETLVGERQRPRYFRPCVIGDMGFVDMTCIVFGYYDFDADLYVVEAEISGRRVVSDDLREQIDAMERQLWPDHVARGEVRRRLDGTARERSELSREGDDAFGAVSRDTKNKGGRMRTFANAARKVCKQRRLVVQSGCTTVIAHAKFARWDTSRTSFVRVKDDRGNPIHHYDGCAALLYFLRDCDATTNPHPLLPPDVSPETHHIPPNLRAEPKRARLAQALGGRRRRRR